VKINFEPAGRFLGVQPTADPAEKIISSVGGFISIALVFYVSDWMTDAQGAASILPSMGAATVLLFGVPRGPLSQPWALFAGNLVSAAIGVACYQWIGSIFVAASAAVGLSMAAMFLCRCVHPPGGATALAAVIGGEAIHDLGFYYVLAPTLINCGIIFSVAMLFNNLFDWRRYPVRGRALQAAPTATVPSNLLIQQALEGMGYAGAQSIPVNRLEDVYQQAQALEGEPASTKPPLQVGARYTNGNSGFDWAVREISDLVPHQDPAHSRVLYRVLAGRNKFRSDCCSVEEFTVWVESRLE
jgi:CBS domain-containing membrane protein